MNVTMTKRTAATLSLVTFAVCIASYGFFDIPVAYYFDAHKNVLTSICSRVTYLGKSEPYLIGSALAFIWFKFVRKRPALAHAALFVFVAVALSGLANDVIKFLVGRSRPKLLIAQQLYAFKPFATRYEFLSFPSGHANTAAAAACALHLLGVRGLPVYAALALLVMLSRVVIGAHFPSDVIFGAYVAIVVTLLAKTLLEKKGPWTTSFSAAPKARQDEYHGIG